MGWAISLPVVQFLKLVRSAGLPDPLSNHELEVPDHGREEVDFYWPAHRLVVETDGWETHGTEVEPSSRIAARTRR